VYNSTVFICEVNVNELPLVLIKDEICNHNKNNYKVTLIIPLLKETKMDLILQKATELGVYEIIPVIMKRSIIKLEHGKEDKKIERWTKICKEASEQSKRIDIPMITNIKTLSQLNSIDGLKVVCSTTEKEKTINLFISVLSGFFKFSLEEEYIEKVLVKHRWRPKIPSSIPKYLDSYEQARIKIISESMSTRNRAIVEFLFSSGCRRSEVASLNIEDIDLDNRTATVIGKGRKIREVYFSDECAILLKEYLREHKGENPALFINCFGNRLTGEGIYKITTKLGIKAGLPYKFNPHRTRHSYGYNMMTKGADIQFIGDSLGHSDLNTTRVYTKIPSQDIRDEYDKKMGWI